MKHNNECNSNMALSFHVNKKSDKGHGMGVCGSIVLYNVSSSYSAVCYERVSVVQCAVCY